MATTLRLYWAEVNESPVVPGGPVTVKTGTRGWYEAGLGITFWTSKNGWDTGTDLYVVTQDTGATPKLRVSKADDRIAPTSFTEQDSADNKTIANVAYPYASWLHTDGKLHIVALTATNTLTHYLFDTLTDQWATGLGTISTNGENAHSIRVVVRSDGDVFVFYTSELDDADVNYSIWDGSVWQSDYTLNGVSHADVSTIVDAGVDSSNYIWIVFYDVIGADVTYKTIEPTADGLSANVDIEATGPTSYQAGSARYNRYDDAGTDKIIVAYMDSFGMVAERTVSLESAAASGNLSTEAFVETGGIDVTSRMPISTAVVGGVPYAVWWDDVNSGTINYTTKVSGSWVDPQTAFGTTGITRLIEAFPVDNGLAVLYQLADDVVFDWIVEPSADNPVSLPDTGTATGTDTLSLAATVAQPDTGIATGADAVSTVSAQTIADTGTAIGTDAATADAARSLADTGTATGADTVAVAAARTLADTGTATGVDTTSVTVTRTITDTGTATGVDGLSVTSSTAVQRDDTGTATGTDTRSIAASVDRPDTGTATGADTRSVAASITRPDTGTATGLDAATVQAQRTVADTGTATGADNRTIAAAILRADTGTATGTDTVEGAAPPQEVSITDTGIATGLDALLLNIGILRADIGTASGLDELALQVELLVADIGFATGLDAATVLYEYVPVDAIAFGRVRIGRIIVHADARIRAMAERGRTEELITHGDPFVRTISE
jgi:hypothetical protein